MKELTLGNLRNPAVFAVLCLSGLCGAQPSQRGNRMECARCAVHFDGHAGPWRARRLPRSGSHARCRARCGAGDRARFERYSATPPATGKESPAQPPRQPPMTCWSNLPGSSSDSRRGVQAVCRRWIRPRCRVGCGRGAAPAASCHANLPDFLGGTGIGEWRPTPPLFGPCSSCSRPRPSLSR